MSFVALCVIVVGVVAWLTAAAVAVRSVSRIWLRHWVERRLAGASLAELYLERPQRLLLSAGTGVALTIFLGGAAAAAGSPDLRTAAVRCAVLSLAVLLVGQTVPRAVARRWSSALVPVLVPVLRALDVLVAPMRAAAGVVARPVAAQAPRTPAEDAREGIEDLLREGALEGVGEDDEIAIITGVVQFGEKSARDVMTPRADVLAIDVDVSPEQQARIIAHAKYSRVPVYRGTLDDVLGLVHAFDVLKAGGDEPTPVLPVAYTPADRPCNELLFQMLRAGRHLAVVREEDGTTAGIVTLEDLLEELVGDIRDEHDEPEPDAPGGAAEQPPQLRPPRRGADGRHPVSRAPVNGTTA
jgi:putative hemolysin